MKKLNLKAIKKQVVALGLAAVMVVGTGTPAYARSLNDAGALGWFYDASEVPEYCAVASPESWYGCYDVGIGGYEYQMVISPLPTGIGEVEVDICRIPDGKGYADTCWYGWFYMDPAYGLATADDQGRVMQIWNWNGDEYNPDITLQFAWNDATNADYIVATPLRSMKNKKADADITGIPGEYSVPPQSEDPNAPAVVFKKVSNAYEVMEKSYYDDGGYCWFGRGWTTDGYDRVEEPWWNSSEVVGGGDGVG